MSRTLKQHVVTFSTGDLATGVTGAGRSVGLVHDIPDVAALIDRLMQEVEAAEGRFVLTMAG